MNKDNFQTIQTNLEQRITECKEHLDGITTTDDLKVLTIAQAQELKEWCKKEQSIMDKIVCSEFRHIIGMGELTVIQTNTFIKLMKEYMNYRSDIKTIAVHFSALDKLPGLPSQSEFELKCLGDFKLKSKIRGRAEKAASVVNDEGYEINREPLVDENGVPVNKPVEAKKADLSEFSITGKSLFFPITKLSEFIKIVNPTLTVDRLLKAIENNDDFAEAVWDKYQNAGSDEVMVKAVLHKCLLNRFKKYLKNNV